MPPITTFPAPPEPGNVYHADALTLTRALPDASVNLIAVDPPYNGVKDKDIAPWDNQWATDKDFLDWLRVHLAEYRRVLKPNGSLYLFASPQMAARVEMLTGEYFNVLNRITWQKPRFATKAEMFDKDTMRAYFPASEAIVFAEQFGSDEQASSDAGWVNAETTLKQRLFGDYIKNEMSRAGVGNREIAALFPSVNGNLTGCLSNWLIGYNIPTSEQYQKMREYLNTKTGGDYLRREYDYLRREYEDLRRPFNSTPYAPYTDVWTFRTVQAYDGKHPTEKPLELMRHIVKMSSRPGDLVLDTFAGSGTTLDAARQEGRRWLGCDITEQYVELSKKRLAQPYTLNMFEQTAP